MIALIDYGLGNLFSVERALQAVKADYQITSKPSDLAKADKLVLPGVGAFGDGMKGLSKRNLVEAIKEEVEKGKLILGICLGMQIMMQLGNEFGKHQGLGLIPGEVNQIKTKEKLPQIGWNTIEKKLDSKILKGIASGSYFYFVHSFVVRPKIKVAAVTNYGGDEFCSVIEYNNVYGAQFHPEKSDIKGIKIYDNFVNKIR